MNESDNGAMTLFIYNICYYKFKTSYVIGSLLDLDYYIVPIQVDCVVCPFAD